MDILDRITALLGDREQKELTSYLKLNNVAFSEWKSGKSKSYRKYLIEIAEFFNVSIDYLVYGKSSSNLSKLENDLLSVFSSLSSTDKVRVMERAETLAELSAYQKENENPVKKGLKHFNKEEMVVPLCELPVSAGTGIYLDGSSTEPLKVRRSAAAEQANYALRVSGDSMNPDFEDGDIIFVETVEQIEVGEIGIFIADGEGFLKERGERALISLNKKYHPRSFNEFESIKCIGRVLGKAEIV